MAYKIRDPEVIEALKKVAADSGGFLRAKPIVDAARPTSSPLHGHFTWDDDEAAERWRLHEAQRLIQVVVAVVAEFKTDEPVRVFVSLRNDRTPVGGYREMIDVLSDPELRASLLEEALVDMKVFKQRYARLSELAAVFATMDATAAKLQRKRRRRA